MTTSELVTIGATAFSACCALGGWTVKLLLARLSRIEAKVGQAIDRVDAVSGQVAYLNGRVGNGSAVSGYMR